MNVTVRKYEEGIFEHQNNSCPRRGVLVSPLSCDSCLIFFRQVLYLWLLHL